MIRQIAILCGVLAALVSCGVDKRFMTSDVQEVARLAVSGCIRALSGGPQLSSLQSQGFGPFRGGYLRRVPNAEILAGDSRVAATIRRGECVVEVWPATLNEMSTMRSITERELSATGATLSATYAHGGSRSQVVANIRR